MRILHVIQELRTGGAERIVVSLSQGADAAGHAVAVAAAAGELADELDAPRYPVPVVRRRPWLLATATRRVAAAVSDWRPDIVHAHNPTMALAAGAATRRGTRPPGLVSVHGLPERDWRAATRLVRLSGLVAVACGPGVAEALREHGRPPLATIPNAVGPPPPPADRRQLEAAWGTSQSRLIVSVGRLVEAKDHGVAIRALAAVPDATLAILGDGPLEASLRAEAAAAGVGDRMVLAGNRPDARAVMGAADAIVLTSRAEGLPLAALEALSSGTPLVATDVRGLRELVTDGVDALLAPAGDAEAIAAALRRVLDDPALAARLAERASHSQRQTVPEMVDAYLALYERLAR